MRHIRPSLALDQWHFLVAKLHFQTLLAADLLPSAGSVDLGIHVRERHELGQGIWREPVLDGLPSAAAGRTSLTSTRPE